MNGCESHLRFTVPLDVRSLLPWESSVKGVATFLLKKTRHRASTSMYSLTFHVRRYAVMCTDCHYVRLCVIIAAKTVH